MKRIHLENNLREPLSAKFLVFLMKHGIAKGIAKRRLLGKEDQAVITVVKNWYDLSLRNDLLDILHELKPESIIYLSWMIHKNWSARISREILNEMNVSAVEILIKEYQRHRINKSTIIDMLGSLRDPSALNFLIYNLVDPSVRRSCASALTYMESIAVPALIKNLDDEKRREPITNVLVHNYRYSIKPLVKSLYDSKSRKFSALCLSKIGEPAASTLIDFSTDPQLKDIILGIMIGNPKGFISSLIESLQNEKSAQFCEMTILKIGKEAIPYLGPHLKKIYASKIEKILLKMGEEAIPYLIHWLTDSRIRPRVTNLLKIFGLKAVPYLINSLGNRDVSKYVERILIDIDKPIHIQLITSLEKREIQTQVKSIIVARGRSILPYLHKELEKQFSESHKAIVEILGIFKDKSSVDPLIRTLHQDKLKEYGKDSLSKIGKNAVPKLILALEDEKTREDLIDLIVSFGGDSVPYLLDSLRVPRLQTYCVKCLEKIGEPAVKDLISLFGDPDLEQIAYRIVVKNGRISVRYLIDSLDYESKKEMCRNSLLEIGEPAVPELISNLSSIHQEEIASLLLKIGERTIPYLVQNFKKDNIRPVLFELVSFFESKAFPYLVESLKDPEIADYSENLLKTIDQPIDRYLVDSLHDETVQTRIKEILLHRDKRALPSLHEKLKEEFQPEHTCIIEILGELKHAESLDYLIMSLQYPEVLDLSRRIISDFGEIAADNLIKALDNDNVAQHATDILLEIGDCVLPYIRHSIHRIRNKKYAIYILGSLKEDQSIRILREFQNSLEKDVCSYTSCALAILGERTNSEILIDSFEKGDDFRLKDLALRALNMNSDPGNVENLLTCLQKEEDNYYKCYLIEILSNIGDLRAVQGILNILESEKDKTVRFFALKTLKKFKNPQYIPQIRENLGIDTQTPFEKWIQDNEELIGIFEKDLIYDEKETNLKDLFKVYQQVFDYSSDRLEKRDQQIQYLILCYEGLIHRIPVVIEGPTGIGKTRALITAFLPFILRDEGYRVLYCTRTINQLENFMEEFGDIRNNMYEKYGHSDIKVTLNIGRNSMREKTCPDRENCEVCELKDEQDYSYNEGDFFMDFNELRKVQNNGHCPLVTARWVTSKRADVVACAFAYLFHERMRDWFLGDEERRSKTILIIDEAHNFLEEVSEKPYITFVSDPKNRGDKSFCDDSSHIYSLQEVVEATQKGEAELRTKRYISRMRDEQMEMYERLSRIRDYDLDDYDVDDYDYLDGGSFISFDSLQFSLSSYFETLNNIIEERIRGTPDNKVLSKEDNKKLIELLNDELLAKGFPDIESAYSQILNEIKNIRSDWDKRNKYPVYYAYHITDSLIKLYRRPYEFMIRKKPGIKAKNRSEKQGSSQTDKFEQVDRLEIFSIHPKKRVQEIASDFYSCIFTSATLSPVEKVSLLLGFNQSICQKMTSPFPEQNYGCFALAGVHSGSKEFTQEKGYRFDLFEKEILFSIIDDILNYTDRSTGIFFSSKETLQELYWAIRELCRYRKRWILLGNDENITGNPRDDYRTLVNIYCTKSGKTLKGKEYRGVENKMQVYKGLGKLLGEGKLEKGAVLVDIIGGMFAEGVNYEGNEMEIGILVGLPFKSFEENERLYKAKSEFFYMLEGDHAFAENLSYRYDAFRKVAQTAGRIHRSKKDRGVILFVDERLLGIKKSIEIGENGRAQWSYNFLSRKNVGEEWRVLQEQLKNKKTVVVPYEQKILEKRDLFSRLGISASVRDRNRFMNFKKLLSEHLEAVESRPPIDSNKMVTKIQNFFAGGENCETESNHC